jgi:hypothetical protein
MADDHTTPATGDTSPGQDTTAEPQTADLDPATGLGDAGKRALAAERVARREAEARVKELEPLAAKARELEEAGKTELQRLTEQLTTAQADATAARGELLRLTVATAKGLPAKLAARLQGDTEEDLAADADALLAAFPTAPTPPGARTPLEALRPGALPTPPEPSLAEQIAAAEAAGEWATARRLKTAQLLQLAQHAT